MIPTSIQSDAQAAEYDPAAKSFHWVTVALVGSQFIIGWIMPGLRHITQPGGLVGLHFSLGIVILGITAMRVMWRFAVGVPAPEASLPRWQHQAAHILHMALYGLLFALVFSGWAYASSHGIPLARRGDGIAQPGHDCPVAFDRRDRCARVGIHIALNGGE